MLDDAWPVALYHREAKSSCGRSTSESDARSVGAAATEAASSSGAALLILFAKKPKRQLVAPFAF